MDPSTSLRVVGKSAELPPISTAKETDTWVQETELQQQLFAGALERSGQPGTVDKIVDDEHANHRKHAAGRLHRSFHRIPSFMEFIAHAVAHQRNPWGVAQKNKC